MAVKSKSPSRLYKSRYFIFLFAFILLYHIVVVKKFQLWQVDRFTYVHYLVDFSMGFCTKFLPGAVYNFLFRGDTAVWKVNLYNITLVLLLFLYVSYMLSKFITTQETAERRKSLLILFVFYLSGPCTFAMLTHELGILEIHLFLLTVAFLSAVENKYLKYAVPVFAVLAIIVHIASLISTIVFFLLILLYEASIQNRKRDRILYLALAAVTLAAAGLMSLYFIINEYDNVVYGMQEFNSIVQQRSQFDEDIFLGYYDGELYKDISSYNYGVFETNSLELKSFWIAAENSRLPAFLLNGLNTVLGRLNFQFRIYTATLPVSIYWLLPVLLILLHLPMMILFFKFFKFKIMSGKKANNRLQAFTFLMLMLYVPIVLVVWYAFSTDTLKYSAHTYLILFTFLLYVLKREPKETVDWLHAYFSKSNILYLLIYFAVYALFVSRPFT